MARFFAWIFLGLAGAAQGSVLSFCPLNNGSDALPGNRDTRYDKWQDPTRVLYRFDEPSYSVKEKELITSAMSKIASDMNKCISFQEYNPDTDVGWDNIYISKTLNDGSFPPTCFTFYGRLLRAAGQGQKMALHDGPNGCMGSPRELMKVLVNVLGLRNEYNRPDRDLHLKINHENLQADLRSSNLLTAYNASQVECFVDAPFDYNSVTIPCSSKYAKKDTRIFEFPSDKAQPTLDHLSKEDCIGLSWIYGCDKSKCADPYMPVIVHVEEAHPVVIASEPVVNISKDLIEVKHVEVHDSSPAPHHDEVSSEAPIVHSSESPIVNVTEAANVTVAAVTEAAVHNVTVHEAEASTPAPVLLNITLNDIIFPRKGAVEEVSTAAAVAVANATEVPIVIHTEASPVVTTVAPIDTTSVHVDAVTSGLPLIEEATASSPQLKLVIIVGNESVAKVEVSGSNESLNHNNASDSGFSHEQHEHHNESLIDDHHVMAENSSMAPVVLESTMAPVSLNESIHHEEVKMEEHVMNVTASSISVLNVTEEIAHMTSPSVVVLESSSTVSDNHLL